MSVAHHPVAVQRLLAQVLDPSGTSARSIASLWWFMLALAIVAFAIFLVGLLVGMRRRHDNAPEDDLPPLEPPAASEGAQRWVFWGGLVLPSVSVVAVIVATIAVLGATNPRTTDSEMTIEVTGHQWWWEIEYPDDNVVTANEIHIPVDVPVRLQLESADVIHSFWVPALAGKMDLLPDRPNELVIDADETGTYPGRCAEFCGLQHAFMGIDVIVHDAEDYERWLAASASTGQVTSADTNPDGVEAFTQSCGSCHVLAGVSEGDGTTAAPDLATFPNRARIGGVLDNTPENLRSWISDPHSFKEGTLMPDLGLSPEQVDLIATYVEGLRP